MDEERCTCPAEGFSAACPWVMEFGGQIVVGHVRACPETGETCPCRPGSTAQALCAWNAAEAA